MKIENDNLYFDSEKEKELYLDLKDYLLKEYKGKRALKRLVNNIAWFMNEGRGDFFAGFVFDTQGTLVVTIIIARLRIDFELSFLFICQCGLLSM